LELDRGAKQRAYALKLADLQDEIAHERRLQRDVSDQQTRDQVLAQHSRQLADLKANQRQKACQSPQSSPDADAIRRTSFGTATANKSHTSTALGPKSSNSIIVSPQDEESRPVTTSSAREEWEHQKEFEVSSEALDNLMGMIGLEEVKEQFLTIKSKVDTVVRQGTTLKDERFGAAFLGNPGTGWSCG